MVATLAAKLSANSFAMLFGVISPNINVITVTTIVETVAAKSAFDLIISVKSKVAIVAAAILTILLPIRIVVINLS